MSVRKAAGFIIIATVLLVPAGLYPASVDEGEEKTPPLPGIISPWEHEPGVLSIIPTDRGKERIEYRDIYYDRRQESDLGRRNRTVEAGLDGFRKIWSRNQEVFKPISSG